MPKLQKEYGNDFSACYAFKGKLDQLFREINQYKLKHNYKWNSLINKDHMKKALLQSRQKVNHDRFNHNGSSLSKSLIISRSNKNKPKIQFISFDSIKRTILNESRKNPIQYCTLEELDDKVKKAERKYTTKQKIRLRELLNKPRLVFHP